jgi:hypothetical protein
MNKLVTGAIASAVLVIASSGAQAAVTLAAGSLVGNQTGYTALGLTLVNDFNSGTLASNGITGNAALVTGTIGARYEAPSGDLTQYLVVPETTAPYAPVGTPGPYAATVALGQAASSVGFYWGSPDDYNNSVELLSGGSVVGTYTATALALAGFGVTSSNVNSIYVRLDSTTAFDSVRFTTGNIAFEVDNLAIAAVPEPGEWAMMLAGLGVVSLIARRRKTQA